jgi:hypothetical protein
MVPHPTERPHIYGHKFLAEDIILSSFLVEEYSLTIIARDILLYSCYSMFDSEQFISSSFIAASL